MRVICPLCNMFKLWHGQLTDRVMHIVKPLDQAVEVGACSYSSVT
jgi:hypothetical protein